LTLAEKQDKGKAARTIKRAYVLVVYYSDVWIFFSNWHTEIVRERSLRKAHDGAIQSFRGL
jgi:hypothetical protein